MIRTIIADDEPAALERYTAYVGDYGRGFSVTASCRSAADAFAAASLRQPDLIFTDIRMPGEDGLSLLGRLRDSGWKGLAVVISGYDDFSYAQQAIRLGVFDFLLKPVFPEDMRGLLDKALCRLGPCGCEPAARGESAGERPDRGLSEPVRKILGFVETHYDSRFSLEDAARVAGVSPAWISSSFKRAFGCSLMEYVRAYRMEKARELLSETDLPLKEIADRLAFPDLPTFSKLFRKISGTSPGAYRKSIRGQGRPEGS
jgi:YesN/AraC family two-component response regulator